VLGQREVATSTDRVPQRRRAPVAFGEGRVVDVETDVDQRV
jgi:hypothetical protein